MHEFGASLRLGKIVFMISRMNQSILKGFRSMEQKLESVGLWLDNCGWIIGFGRLKREDGEISRSRSRGIETYFSTQGIYLGIKSNKLATQGNPPKR